jgi:thiol-disulfide isomerase/thioredoxin
MLVYQEYNFDIVLLYKFMKKLLIIIFIFSSTSSFAVEKSTTFTKEIFNKAQSEGKIVVVSSWTKYCSSCASQMKVLDKAKNEFDNIEFLTFEIKNKEIANLLNVQYQTTLLIFKDNKEVYRSIGETTKDLIYKAIKNNI